MSEPTQREWRFYLDDITRSDIPALLVQVVALRERQR